MGHRVEQMDGRRAAARRLLGLSFRGAKGEVRSSCIFGRFSGACILEWASARGLCILDSFVGDVLWKLFGEAVALSRYAGRQTVSWRDMRSSAKLVLPGELSSAALE